MNERTMHAPAASEDVRDLLDSLPALIERLEDGEQCVDALDGEGGAIEWMRRAAALFRALRAEGEAIGDVYEEIASYAERGSSRNGSRLVPIPTLQHWAHTLAALRSESAARRGADRNSNRTVRR